MFRRESLHCPTIDSDERRLSHSVVLFEVQFVLPQLPLFFLGMNPSGIEQGDVILYYYLVLLLLFNYIILLNYLIIINDNYRY